MPWFLPLLAAVGSGVGSAAGAAGGALGSAAGAAGSALGSAGSAIGSGLGSAGSAIGSGLGSAGSALGSGLSSVGGALGKGLQAVPEFLSGGGGGGEAGQIASLGQSVPSGVSFAGPSTPLSGPEISQMFYAQPGTPSSELAGMVPASFQAAQKPGLLAQLGPYKDLLPLLQSLGGQGQGQQQPPAVPPASGEIPTFEPGGFPAIEEDPLAFLRAFHIQG